MRQRCFGWPASLNGRFRGRPGGRPYGANFLLGDERAFELRGLSVGTRRSFHLHHVGLLAIDRLPAPFPEHEHIGKYVSRDLLAGLIACDYDPIRDSDVAV